MNVDIELKTQRDNERKTSCCIMNDGDGCFQASELECSVSGSSFVVMNSLWSKSNEEEGNRCVDHYIVYIKTSSQDLMEGSFRLDLQQF